MELRQASIASCNPGNALQHGVAIHFKLPIGKRVAGQRVHREQGPEVLAIGGRRNHNVDTQNKARSGPTTAPKRALAGAKRGRNAPVRVRTAAPGKGTGLVQPTDRPHKQEDGNGNTQQPQQSCTRHFGLLCFRLRCNGRTSVEFQARFACAIELIVPTFGAVYA